MGHIQYRVKTEKCSLCSVEEWDFFISLLQPTALEHSHADAVEVRSATFHPLESDLQHHKCIHFFYFFFFYKWSPVGMKIHTEQHQWQHQCLAVPVGLEPHEGWLHSPYQAWRPSGTVRSLFSACTQCQKEVWLLARVYSVNWSASIIPCNGGFGKRKHLQKNIYIYIPLAHHQGWKI